MILSFSRRNEVGARQYFQKRVSRILSTGGRGCAWQGGHAWRWGAMCGRGHAWQGVCMAGACVAKGACMAGGRAWQILRDTVNERAVSILLECILVL